MTTDSAFILFKKTDFNTILACLGVIFYCWNRGVTVLSTPTFCKFGTPFCQPLKCAEACRAYPIQLQTLQALTQGHIVPTQDHASFHHWANNWQVQADLGGGGCFQEEIAWGAGKARFNVATPTYATVTAYVLPGGPVKLDSMWQHRLTRPLHVQHTYYCIIYKQNPFNIISRGVQRWTSTDFRLK